MATVSVCVCRTQNTFPDGSPLPVVSSSAVLDESFTSSGTSQATSGSVGTLNNNSHGLVWEISSSGGAVWVTFGTSPTAAAGTTYLVPDGAVRHFGVGGTGEKAAIIDA